MEILSHIVKLEEQHDSFLIYTRVLAPQDNKIAYVSYD